MIETESRRSPLSVNENSSVYDDIGNWVRYCGLSARGIVNANVYLRSQARVSEIQRVCQNGNASVHQRKKIRARWGVCENGRRVLRVNDLSGHGLRHASENDHASDCDRPVHIRK